MWQDKPVYNVDEYIAQHNHINYCEAIVFKNGDVMDVRPSHQETLVRLAARHYGVTRDELYSMIPIEASPLHWIVEDLGLVALWYDFAVVPYDMSDEQVATIKKLQECNILSDTDFCYKATREKTITTNKRLEE